MSGVAPRFNPFTGLLDYVVCSPISKPGTFVITPGNSLVVDSGVFADMLSVEYFVAMSNNAKTQIRTLKITAKKGDGDVDYVTYSNVGVMDAAPVAQLNGANYELEVTNNEAFDVYVDLTITKL